jgi:hypothetical protein
MSAISTQGLGKRYGSKWALRDCTIEVPEGSVTALRARRSCGAPPPAPDAAGRHRLAVEPRPRRAARAGAASVTAGTSERGAQRPSCRLPTSQDPDAA